MNKELTKEEAEEYYNKLWLENKDLIQENIDKLNKKRFALEMELIDKNKEIERLNNIISNIENYIRARADDDYTCSVCSVMIDDLLNILERSDKE